MEPTDPYQFICLFHLTGFFFDFSNYSQFASWAVHTRLTQQKRNTIDNMKCYIITYDLRKFRNYDALYFAIKSYGTWGKITESTWAIVTNQSTAEIRNYLLNFIDNDDRLFVIKSGGEAAWQNTIAENHWLQQHLPKIY